MAIITLGVHVIRRSARIRILLRLTRQGSIFINMVLSLIIVWYLHGETKSSIYGDEALHNANATRHHAITNNVGPSTTFVQMVYDVVGPQFNANIVEEFPNSKTQNFYDMLNAANQEVWPSCQTHLHLSTIARMLHIKSEHQLSERWYDALC